QQAPKEQGDFAYCVLKEAANDVPIIPVLYGCEQAILKPGQEIVLVGFGATTASDTPNILLKNWVKTEISSFQDGKSNSIILGDAMHNNCFGDSGGPAFVKLPDGTWRLFADASTTNVATPDARAEPCATPGRYGLLAALVPYIESRESLDI